MIRALLASAAATMLAAPLAAAPPAKSAHRETTAVQTINSSDAKVLDRELATEPTISGCEGRQFPFQSLMNENGKRHVTRIVLCSDKGASNEKMIGMIEDALRKVEANDKLPSANKAQIVAQMKTKIAQLKAN